MRGSERKSKGLRPPLQQARPDSWGTSWAGLLFLPNVTILLEPCARGGVTWAIQAMDAAMPGSGGEQP